MMSKLFRAVILGAPASGKGTISKRIVDKFGFDHISPGDILRMNVKNNTKLGKEAKVYIDQGKLVPDDLIIKCVTSRLQESHGKSWMLDGFPRTRVQAERLAKMHALDAVINLEVPHEVIIDRVKGRWLHLPSGRVYNIGFNEPKVPGKDDITGEELVQRDDDKPEIVAQRLQVYEEMMKPVLDFYYENNLVTNFKGKTTAEIWPKVEQFLVERTKALMAGRL
ncbi:GTP:AMP phosphotransferase AK3, mitochondrial isoform X4 [Musca domestica]|uniref:GTP:AMP phosphotransferase, mitochondrial n=1 Tax=Musca domestica TaxID=7370 RepID=A0A1I8N396_MUSDO|nr:GTP:AMP phosphotransferase AK3, mitochondrial isoform X4 [Musca domestica]XP_058974190.1 GTP:AMP phosphotransferase AK3, mitochondrial isoform X4 [Musca domestica]